MRPEHPHFEGPPWQEAVRAAGGWTAPREIRGTAPVPFDPQGIVRHVIPKASPQTHDAEVLAALGEMAAPA